MTATTAQFFESLRARTAAMDTLDAVLVALEKTEQFDAHAVVIDEYSRILAKFPLPTVDVAKVEDAPMLLARQAA